MSAIYTTTYQAYHKRRKHIVVFLWSTSNAENNSMKWTIEYGFSYADIAGGSKAMSVISKYYVLLNIVSCIVIILDVSFENIK